MRLFKYKKLQHWVSLFILLPGLLIAGCGTHEKTQDTQPHRIGILLGLNVFQPTVAGFKAGLLERGFKEGENIVYDVQEADGDSTRMKEISNQFIAQNVDLIFATPTGAVKVVLKAAKKASIPVVFANTTNPVELGLLKSYREPEIGVTGVYSRLDEYIGKRLEILKKLSPEVKSVWVPHNPSYHFAPKVIAALRKAAQKLNLNLIGAEMKTPDEVVASLKAIKVAFFDAILTFPDTTVQKSIAWEAMRNYAVLHRLPLVANTRKQVEEGALFSYRLPAYESGRLAAELAKKMLEGRGSVAIPMIKTQPHLVINMKTTTQIGLEIDPVLLETASELIR